MTNVSVLTLALLTMSSTSCRTASNGPPTGQWDPQLDYHPFEDFPHIALGDACIVRGVPDRAPNTLLTEEERRLNLDAARSLMKRLKATRSPVQHVREAIAAGLPIVEKLGIQADFNDDQSLKDSVELIVVDVREKWTCTIPSGRTITFLTMIAGWQLSGKEAVRRWPDAHLYYYTFAVELQGTSRLFFPEFPDNPS